jgi:hypothetical protein
MAAAKKHRKFDPHEFLSTIDGGRKIEAVPTKKVTFAQGTPPTAFSIYTKAR